jgi:hypothetical protein
VVVLSERSLSFKDLNGDGLLVILIGGEDLGLFGGDVRALRNDLAHHSTDSFNTERKRGAIYDNHTI